MLKGLCGTSHETSNETWMRPAARLAPLIPLPVGCQLPHLLRLAIALRISPSSFLHSIQSINPVAMKLALVLVVLITAVAADRVVDELVKNGLPVGLLPSSVASYAIDKGGHFTLDLNAPCYARIDDQLVYYSPNITGRLKYGSISSLDGIQTKQLFVWLPVTGIYVDVPATPYIYFEVGVLTKRLAVAVFDSPIKCSSKVGTGLRIPSWM